MKPFLLNLLLAFGVLFCAIAAPAFTTAVLIPFAVFFGVVWLIADLARGFRRSRLVLALNTLPANVGSSKHSRRYRASAALATRYLFVKAGADDEHIAAIAATSDKPLGIIVDEAAAAEDLVTVDLVGINGRTLPCVAGAAIATLGLDVYITATGKVVGKPTAAGTYWRVGKNLTLAGADGDPVEIAPSTPRKLIVVAALTQTSNATIAAVHSTAVNPTKADFDALLAEAGKLQADFYVLSAALSGDADVTVATT